MQKNKILTSLALLAFFVIAGVVSAQGVNATTVTPSAQMLQLVEQLVGVLRPTMSLVIPSSVSETPASGISETYPVVSNSNATTNSGYLAVPTCWSGDIYNRQSGVRCVQVIRATCQAGDIYNAQTGERCAQIGSTTYHPADTNGDYRVTLAEVTAYAATHSPNDPNLISATRIWRNGEVYSTY